MKTEEDMYVCMYVELRRYRCNRRIPSLTMETTSIVNDIVDEIVTCGRVLTQEWLRGLSFARLECGVHDRLHIYPMCVTHGVNV